MANNNQKKLQSIVEQTYTSGSGYDIIRHICLPDLLGKDAKTILYVMGKNLSRDLNLSSMEDIVGFFEKAGWGELSLIKEKRRELIFELSGDVVTRRMITGIDDEYRLEAGILSEAIQKLKQAPCECMEEIKRRKNIVQFNVFYSK